MIRGVESVERKLSPVGFNAFAIIGLLVILPFTTAILTNLASINEDAPFEDIVDDGTNFLSGGNPNGVHGGTLHSNWLNIGGNYTTQYQNIDSSMTDNDLECFHLIEDNAFYSSDPLWNINVTQCDHWGAMISPYLESLGYTNYNFAGRNYMSMSKTHNFVPGNNYYGASGTDFAFSVEQPIFDNVNKEKDIGAFQVKMFDDSVIYDCSNAPEFDIKFDYSITFVSKNNILETTHYRTINYNNWETLTIDGFEYDGDNIMKINDVQNWVFNNIFDFGVEDFSSCVLALDLNFNFDGLNALDIADFVRSNGNNMSNISAIIEIENLRSQNETFFSTGNEEFIPLPFKGNGEYKVSYGVKYVSVTNTNFFLKGGALILGVGLFALAIASTPYWDPFANLFKGRA